MRLSTGGDGDLLSIYRVIPCRSDSRIQTFRIVPLVAIHIRRPDTGSGTVLSEITVHIQRDSVSSRMQMSAN